MHLTHVKFHHWQATVVLGQTAMREIHFTRHSTDSQQGMKRIHPDMVKGWERNCIFWSTFVININQMLVGMLHLKCCQSALHQRAATVHCIRLRELSPGSQSHFTRVCWITCLKCRCGPHFQKCYLSFTLHFSQAAQVIWMQTVHIPHIEKQCFNILTLN